MILKEQHKAHDAVLRLKLSNKVVTYNSVLEALRPELSKKESETTLQKLADDYINASNLSKRRQYHYKNTLGLLQKHGVPPEIIKVAQDKLIYYKKVLTAAH